MLTPTGFIYIVIVCLVLEAFGLFVLWAMRRQGLRPIEVLAFLGAGASFTMALLIVASDGPLYALAASLGSAFVFHLLDIFLRWHN